MDEDMTMPELLRKVSALEQRLQYVEELMNVRRPGMDSSPVVDPMWQTDGLSEVRDLARKGEKLQAIKRYRALKGAGLREAQAAVEAMQGRG